MALSESGLATHGIKVAPIGGVQSVKPKKSVRKSPKRPMFVKPKGKR